MNLIIYIIIIIYISHAKRKKNPNLILKTVIKSRENKRTRTRQTYKTMNKMAIRTCILTITLNLTGLNDLINDNEWLKKKKLPTRDALQI